MTDTRQPYDPRKGEEALLRREPRSRRAGDPARIVRWIAFAVAILAFVGFLLQMLSGAYVDAPAPLYLPSVSVAALIVAMWTALGPAMWTSPFHPRRWKISGTIWAAIGCAVAAPILVAGMVGVVALITDIAGVD